MKFFNSKIAKQLFAVIIIYSLAFTLSACAKNPASTESSSSETKAPIISPKLNETAITDEVLNELFAKTCNKEYSRNDYTFTSVAADSQNFLFIFTPYPGKETELNRVIYHYSLSENKTTKIYDDKVRPFSQDLNSDEANPGIHYDEQLQHVINDKGIILFSRNQLIFFNKDYNLTNEASFDIDNSDDSLVAVSPDGESVLLIDNKMLYLAQADDISKRSELPELNYMRGATFSSDSSRIFQLTHEDPWSLKYIRMYEIASKKLTTLSCYTLGEFNAHGEIFPYDETHMLLSVLNENDYVGEGDLHFFLLDFVNDKKEPLTVEPTTSIRPITPLANSKGVYAVNNEYALQTDECEPPYEFDVTVKLFSGEEFFLDFEENKYLNISLSPDGSAVFILFYDEVIEGGFRAAVYSRK